MLKNDIIKIRLVQAGYLSNYPPHLLSDEEMVEGFYNYFEDTYYNPMKKELLSPTSVDPYHSVTASNYDEDEMVTYLDNLYEYIKTACAEALKESAKSGDDFIVDDWIYSYMLGVTVGPKSEILDIHDVLVLLNVDNVDDIFTRSAAVSCYNISRRWIAKTTLGATTKRPPTVFAESHVIKSLRLDDVSL